MEFQSTFPHGERRNRGSGRADDIKSFNPRSRTGNDAGVSPQSAPGVRSFNPRSRTGNDAFHIYRHLCACGRFNPRSRTGNDAVTAYLSITSSMFQSTFPHGERRQLLDLRLRLLDVSIHVPARGTTLKGITVTLYEREFQSTFPHGERRGNRTAGKSVSWKFQSTFPHGERRSNHPQISFVLFALIYAIIPINSVQRNLQHALLLTSPQNYSANPPGILCSLQTRTTLSLRCLLLKITKNIHCTTS